MDQPAAVRVAAALLALGLVLAAPAQARRPDGGLQLAPEATDRVSAEMDRHMVAAVESNLAKLRAEGRLPATVPPKVSGLVWPMGPTPGIGSDWHAISGFVDLDPRFPNLRRDYTCATGTAARTYDTAAGYNHRGIDYIIWPFPWHLMDTGAIDVRAAAPGTLIEKNDGTYDRNCSWDVPDVMNYVIVLHADGTIARYLHMKRGTVTTRPIGSAITAGEFLGKVGSSGISKLPHLHFELRQSNAVDAPVIEPHTGTCNTRATAWAVQRPYHDPKLSRLSTHSAPPHYPTCPDTTELPRLQDQFAPGAPVTFLAAYRDVRIGQVTDFRVTDAAGATFREWSFDPDEDPDVTTEYVNGAYWIWTHTLPADAPHGLWRVDATFAGTKSRHAFRVGNTTTAIADMRGLIGAWFEPATSGQGFEFHWINGDTALVFFYGHHDDGRNFFLLGQRDGPFDFGQELVFSMYQTTGGRWTGLDPALIQRPTWGTLRITFVDCGHAVAELDGVDGAQVLTLERLGRTLGLDCQ